MNEKRFEIVVPVRQLAIDDLDAERRKLVDEACAARTNAYAPYSHFSVGAAIALDNGETVTGANQENAAFPSGTCAERTACFYAHAHHPTAKFRRIAIAAKDADGNTPIEPLAPCGACRQALLEYEKLAGENVELIMVGRDKVYILPSISSTLPFAFTDF